MTQQDGSSTWYLTPENARSGMILYFHRFDGSSADGLTPNGVPARGPSISRDGRYLGFYAVTESAFGVVIRVLDLQTRNYVGTDIPGILAEWSPASDSLAFVELPSRRLRLMHSTMSGGRYITPPGGEVSASQQLAWSPDGRWIVAPSQTGLEVIEVSTGLRLPLAFAANLRNVAWKPGS